MHNGRKLALVGAAGLLLGALMPWASVSSGFISVTVAGYEGDGILTGAAGVLILLIALIARGQQGKRYSYGIVGLAVVAAGIAGYDIVHAQSVAEDVRPLANASVEIGLYFTLVSAIVALVGGWQRVPAAPYPAVDILPPYAD